MAPTKKAAMKAATATKKAMKAMPSPMKALKAMKKAMKAPTATMQAMQATKKAMKASATKNAAMTAMQTGEGDAGGSKGGPTTADWAAQGWVYNETTGWCGRKSWKLAHRGAQLQRLTLDFRTMWVTEEWGVPPVPARGGR